MNLTWTLFFLFVYSFKCIEGIIWDISFNDIIPVAKIHYFILALSQSVQIMIINQLNVDLNLNSIITFQLKARECEPFNDNVTKSREPDFLTNCD